MDDIVSYYCSADKAIIDDMDRTSTIMQAKGGYSGDTKMVVMVSFTMNQYAQLMSIVAKLDRDAFMTINQAHEINGEGFSKYDLKPKKK
jgi:uncharacterized membrane-anchored protein YitT (DUF2179 family)